VLRILVLNGFSADMVDHLAHVVDDLSRLTAPPPISRPRAYHQ
jgi:hypothetical protein